MPRLKQAKLQGFQAFICHHPFDQDSPYDDLGRTRCPRCGWKVTRVLTHKGFDLAMEQIRKREGW